jgi:hypothetical protein
MSFVQASILVSVGRFLVTLKYCLVDSRLYGQRCSVARFLLSNCEEVTAEETVPFIRRLPRADSRFDAPEDLSLKLLFQLDSEHSSDGEVFDYRKSDSLRDLTAKLSVCSIVETDFYLIDATGLGKRVGKILWRGRTKLNGTLSSSDSDLRSKSSGFNMGGFFKESA